MMHGSWDIKAQGIEFLAIWGHFLPFDPLTTPKIKFLKKWKTLLEISSFYTSVHHKWQSYDVWFLKYEACRQNLSFSLFLPFYCSNSPKNQNKKKKTTCRYHFAHKYQKVWPDVPEIWCVMDRQTKGQKNWHTEVGAPPKNIHGMLNVLIRIHWRLSKNF